MTDVDDKDNILDEYDDSNNEVVFLETGSHFEQMVVRYGVMTRPDWSATTGAR